MQMCQRPIVVRQSEGAAQRGRSRLDADRGPQLLELDASPPALGGVGVVAEELVLVDAVAAEVRHQEAERARVEEGGPPNRLADSKADTRAQGREAGHPEPVADAKVAVTAPTVGEAFIVGKRGGTMIGMVAERFWRGRGGGAAVKARRVKAT
eukprot:CAMPEP_0185287994 /NCGR_PEP_ID=MMETSP1363-20130426/3142_1 /TAXON_ID=38817 /ORGANISM="Gephyrocapsa oceanica, Strain RCC1303" /LENGTH=152 /DNA_ID=CAMNT_0027883857 /DNA_START=196 /DNA_END=651 /DNA_ORIENTATION=+